DRPTDGVYSLEGHAVDGFSDDELSRIRRDTFGFIFQSYHLIPRLSAQANVEVPMVFAGVPKAERARRSAEALAAVGLSERAKHRPAELSGGQRQRVAIARATILAPRILLADEPTGNLDSAAGAQVLALLDKLHGQGLTLIMVTHDPKVAARAERVLLLEDGRVAKRLTGAQLAAAGEGPSGR
ncbi:MAG: ABC transporter ATP-binding protein, partial [Planctomycetota bacterium]|nr:ABC transporter ATP-binding protein [Planctomycetota bacterium]